jgi:hypothetical protein
MKNILQSETEEVKGDWRKSGNGVHVLYFSSHIQEIKLRSTKWAWRVMCGNKRNVYGMLVGKL